MTTLAKPKRLNHVDVALPGNVGSVGDTMTSVRLAQSAPEFPLRFDPQFFNRMDNGSILTGQPYTYDSAWNMGRGEQTAYGLMQQDIRAPDKLHEPTLGAIPQYEWRNKLATVYKAKRTGDKFLPLPGTYSVAEGEMVRGGQVVRTTDIEGLYSVVENQQPSPSVGLARDNEALMQRLKKLNTPLGSLKIVTNPVKPSIASSTGNVSIMDPSSSMGNNSIVSPGNGGIGGWFSAIFGK